MPDLEKYTDKYRQMLETTGDSGREMRELTRENARLVTGTQTLNKQIQEKDGQFQHLTTEKDKVDVLIKDNKKEIMDLERVVSGTKQSLYV